MSGPLAETNKKNMVDLVSLRSASPPPAASPVLACILGGGPQPALMPCPPAPR